MKNMQFETDIWEKLKMEKPVIFLYGTGNGADRVFDRLQKDSVPVTGVFASDGFVRDRYFRGFKVMSFSEADVLYPNMTVLMCFGSKRPEVLSFVKKISEAHPFFVPEVPVYGDEIFDLSFYKKHISEIDKVREILSDELSLKTFDGIINYKLSGDIKHLFGCEIPEPDFYRLIQKKDDIRFLDLGAYNGDTVKDFINNINSYSEIIAVEPDNRNFRKLCENTEAIKNITRYNAAAGDFSNFVFLSSSKGKGSHISGDGISVPVFDIDKILHGKKVDIIKIDVEGNETGAINSGKNTIEKFKPAMKIACYHRSSDIFSIPLKIREIRPDYKIYMRHTPHIPAWDTEFYFI